MTNAELSELIEEWKIEGSRFRDGPREQALLVAKTMTALTALMARCEELESGAEETALLEVEEQQTDELIEATFRLGAQSCREIASRGASMTLPDRERGIRHARVLLDWVHPFAGQGGDLLAM